jgi:hypothetical protein
VAYYIAYNRNLGNVLVGVSGQEIHPIDGVTVEIRDGNMPDMSRWAWNAAILDFYEKPRRRLSKLELMNRFTDTELANIYSAAKSSVMVGVWMEKLNAASPEADGTSVDLEDPRTVAGIQSLEAGGLIAAGRAAEILA